MRASGDKLCDCVCEGRDGMDMEYGKGVFAFVHASS